MCFFKVLLFSSYFIMNKVLDFNQISPLTNINSVFVINMYVELNKFIHKFSLDSASTLPLLLKQTAHFTKFLYVNVTFFAKGFI